MPEPHWPFLRGLKKASWSDTGVKPVPQLAPSFRLFGDAATTVWAATFNNRNWRVDMLDDRWALDITDTNGPAAMVKGQTIVWLGVGEDETGADWCVWPPSRITRVARHPTGNALRVWSLRDTWHTAIDVKEAKSPSIAIPWNTMRRDPTPVQITRDVLQWWALDVWCSSCGGLGHVVDYGMLPPPPADLMPLSQPWEVATAEPGGCDVTQASHGMACPRCGNSWGDPALTHLWWPKDASVWLGTTLSSIAELLEEVHCRTVSNLKELIDNELDEDLLTFDVQDNCLEIGIGLETIPIQFPITLSEFWTEIYEAEERSYLRTSCSTLAQEIISLERFDISLHPTWTRSNTTSEIPGFPEVPEYSFQRAAPSAWTFQDWVEKRLIKTLKELTKMGIHVDWSSADSPEPADTLKTLRLRHTKRGTPP